MRASVQRICVTSNSTQIFVDLRIPKVNQNFAHHYEVEHLVHHSTKKKLDMQTQVSHCSVTQVAQVVLTSSLEASIQVKSKFVRSMLQLIQRIDIPDQVGSATLPSR
jgi:hypothetical protein